VAVREEEEEARSWLLTSMLYLPTFFPDGPTSRYLPTDIMRYHDWKEQEMRETPTG
jgi:hypothetical protein